MCHPASSSLQTQSRGVLEYAALHLSSPTGCASLREIGANLSATLASTLTGPSSRKMDTVAYAFLFETEAAATVALHRKQRLMQCMGRRFLDRKSRRQQGHCETVHPTQARCRDAGIVGEPVRVSINVPSENEAHASRQVATW